MSRATTVVLALCLVAVLGAGVWWLWPREQAASPGGEVAAPAAVVSVPPELADSGWLDALRARQLETASSIGAFHDFTFTDRQPETGITWIHRIVDDAGKTYKPQHYDHGNGMAVADVDD